MHKSKALVCHITGTDVLRKEHKKIPAIMDDRDLDII